MLLLLKSPDFQLESVKHWLLKADTTCDIASDPTRHHVDCDQSLEYESRTLSSKIRLVWMGSAQFTSPVSEAILKDREKTVNLGSNSLRNIRALTDTYYTGSLKRTTIRFSHNLSGRSNWEMICEGLLSEECWQQAEKYLEIVSMEIYDAILAEAKHVDHPFTEPI